MEPMDVESLGSFASSVPDGNLVHVISSRFRTMNSVFHIRSVKLLQSVWNPRIVYRTKIFRGQTINDLP